MYSISKLFFVRNYSYRACEFECFLKRSEEICGCVPWNYPHLNETTTLCDGQSAYCFENEMESGSSDCGCQENCNGIQYLISDISKNPIDSARECIKQGPVRFKPELYRQGWKVGDDYMTSYDSLKSYDLNYLIGEKLKHMEGAEYQFWINYLNDIFLKHEVGMPTFKWDSLSQDYLADFAKFADDLYVKNRYVKYMSPEVCFMRAI